MATACKHHEVQWDWLVCSYFRWMVGFLDWENDGSRYRKKKLLSTQISWKDSSFFCSSAKMTNSNYFFYLLLCTILSMIRLQANFLFTHCWTSGDTRDKIGIISSILPYSLTLTFTIQAVRCMPQQQGALSWIIRPVSTQTQNANFYGPCPHYANSVLH